MDNIVDKFDDLVTYALNKKCPVSLHVPTDLQNASLSIPPGREHLRFADGVPRQGRPLSPPSDAAQITEINALCDTILRAAKDAHRVLVIIGNQIVNYGLQKLIHNVVALMGCDVMHGPRLSGVFSPTHSAYVPRQQLKPDYYDLVIQAGFELSDMTGNLFVHKQPDIQLSAQGVRVFDWSVKSVHFPLVLLAMRDRYEGQASGALRAITSKSSSLESKYECLDLLAPITVEALAVWVAVSGSAEDLRVWDLGSAVNDLLSVPSCIERPYILQEFYATIGWALPATLGVLKSCCPKPRVLQCYIGDGALLMTAQELVTLHIQSVKENVPTQVFLLDNSGYLIERVIYENSYNNLPPIEYEGLAKFSKCQFARIRTIDDLNRAIAAPTPGALLLHIVLDKYDFLDPKATKAFGQKVATVNGIPLDGPTLPEPTNVKPSGGMA
eukprot:Gregarina_sp_Poly_1__27@NODE_1005_length_5396_cov_91_149184_g326_i2_p1_GENE_NODE_1005_length_5396_cov_91_149184_g326_i2NODE_1005_length_5396_cov_91_149184_g326_i2_p1_ORF_typecomplete_len512_score61_19TPP_enzyme_C/PF02775_21/1e17TPP_enzyme_N/PF02776_18/1_3e09TPP_enzyme_N/PF02776_18/5_6e03TPP_enzyme_M/PF00205_22/2_1e05_NODE_1005_length_5396_cov_91_149184_g326_i238605182